MFGQRCSKCFVKAIFIPCGCQSCHLTAEKQPGGVLWNSIASHGTSGNVGVISGCHNDRGTVLALSR